MVDEKEGQMRRQLAVGAARAIRAVRGLCPDRDPLWRVTAVRHHYRESGAGLASADAIVTTWPARPSHRALATTPPAIALTPMPQHRPERGYGRAW
jgi:hypothetical protein